MDTDLLFVSNITEEILKEEYKGIALMFETLDAIYRLTKNSMMVIDFASNKIIYKTDNLIFVNEAIPADYQRDSPNQYWALMREDDLVDLLHSRQAHLNLIEGLSYNERLNLTNRTHFNIHLNNRSYVITQTFTPLKLRPDGSLWLGLFCFTNSPRTTSDENISTTTNNSQYKYNKRAKKYLSETENFSRLTPIETTILNYSMKGMTSEYIASVLCKSTNTIKTHKKRIYKKLKVHSMAEALTVFQNLDK